eukprot:scaffold15229_cov148-Skeletonema_marinoi.AAC.1
MAPYSLSACQSGESVLCWYPTVKLLCNAKGSSSASIFIAKQHRGSRCYIKLAQVILVDNTIHSVTNRRLVSGVERVAVHQLSVDEGIQSNQSRHVLTANRSLHMFILDNNSNNISAVSSRLWQSAVVS